MRRLGVLPVAAVIVALGALSAPRIASADDSVGPTPSHTDLHVSVTVPGHRAPSPHPASPTAVHHPDRPSAPASPRHPSTPPVTAITLPTNFCNSPQAMQWFPCAPNAPKPPTTVPVGTAPAPTTPPASPVVLAQAARADLPIDMPQPHTSPTETGFQLVAIPTWFWFEPADWHAVSATASAGGVTATVTARPVSATWDAGDGTDPITCHGPGSRYTPDLAPTCAHTYTDDGVDTVHVTVTWAATWTSNTGARGSQADITLATTLPLTIKSAQAVTD
jgi:hypothetical protein